MTNVQGVEVAPQGASNWLHIVEDNEGAGAGLFFGGGGGRVHNANRNEYLRGRYLHHGQNMGKTLRGETLRSCTGSMGEGRVDLTLWLPPLLDSVQGGQVLCR